MKIEINLPRRGWLSRRLQRRLLMWLKVHWGEGQRITFYSALRSLYYGHRSHHNRIAELEDRVMQWEEAVAAAGITLPNSTDDLHANQVPLDGQQPGGGGDDKQGPGCVGEGAVPAGG